jgi:hypothetical protein
MPPPLDLTAQPGPLPKDRDNSDSVNASTAGPTKRIPFQDRADRRPLRGDDTNGSSRTLAQLAASLERRFKVRVLVDPAIAASARPGAPADELPIDQALNAALASLHRVVWRRVYLAPAQFQSLPPTEILAAGVRAMEQRERGSLLLEDPEEQRVTALLKEQKSASSLESLLHLGKLDSRPLYLIFSSGAPMDGPPAENRFADLQRQQIALPLRPEHRAMAMLGMMQLLQALPPADREAFAGRTLEAGMRLWESTPPEQRQAMIRQSLQLMQEFGAAPKEVGAGGNGVSRHPAGSAVRAGPGDTRALAAALSDRFHAVVLVDPALLVTTPVELPKAELTVEQALTAVAAALPAAAGRRIFLTEAQRQRLPAVEKLAAAARGIASLAPFSLLIENPAAQRSTLYLREQPIALLPALKEQGRFSREAVYLLYDTSPDARGGTVEERVADLQQQQIGLMLRMDPAQMAQSMALGISAFPGADEEMRARLMGLPAMAGLMAAWMPREAKERGGPLAP